jgi:hypothetical protein
MTRNLIGNRVTEKDIRLWLTANGFAGQTAQIIELELHAIKRPGWLQIFRFHLQARPQPVSETASAENDFDSHVEPAQWVELYGSVRDDERESNPQRRTQIQTFSTSEDRDQNLESLSDGLLTLKKGQTGDLGWLLMIGFVILLICAILANLNSGL